MSTCRAVQAVIVPLSVMTIASSSSSLLSSCVTTCGFIGVSRAGAALVHQLAPVLHALLRLLQKLAALVLLEQRKQLGQDPLAVADQADVDRIAKADPFGIEFDLDGFGLSGLRIEFDIGEARADDQQGVAAFQRFLATAWCRAFRPRRWCKGCRRGPLACRAAACRSAPAAARQWRAAPASRRSTRGRRG